MTAPKDILKEAISLAPIEKAQLVDSLISSLDKSDEALDQLWTNEAESRLAAYKDHSRYRSHSLYYNYLFV